MRRNAPIGRNLIIEDAKSPFPSLIANRGEWTLIIRVMIVLPYYGRNKTSRADDLAAIQAHYSLQLSLYAKALERITNSR